MDTGVVRDSEIMSGEPAFRGTRVSVRTLFEYLEADMCSDRLIWFPSGGRMERALICRLLGAWPAPYGRGLKDFFKRSRR